MTKKQALERACRIVGGKSAMARFIGIERQAVQNWFKNGVPAGRAIQIEKATNGEVTVYDLRPDLYG